MKVNTAIRMGEVKEYYFSRKLREIAALRSDGADIINLGIGSPDLHPPDDVVQALRDSLTMPAVHQYQSYSGIPSLRKAISDWYEKHFHVHLDPNGEVLPLIGSKEGIMHISMAYLSPGDAVLVPDPGYPTYSAAAKLCEAEIIKYDLSPKSNWLPDLEALERLDLQKVKIMWVNYPHMPSGERGNKAFFTNLIAFAKKHQLLICNDNPYSFILNESPMSLLSVPGAKEVSLELNSLSKSHHMAGWRIGMVCGKSEFISAILRFKSNMDSGMFRAVQEAAVCALKTPTSWHNKQNAIYSNRQTIAYQIMQSLQCVASANQVGLFVWAKIPAKWKNGFELSDWILKEAEVFITPGGIFGDNGNSYLRISLCNSESILNEALDRIKKLKRDK